MRYDAATLIVFGLCQLVGLIMVVRLWLPGGPRMGIGRRAIWSVVLLVPLIGILIYGLIRGFPSEHTYECPDSTGGSGDPT